MVGAIPVSVPLREENDFNPCIGDYRSRITPRTRMMIIKTPNNPTGFVCPESFFERLAQFAQEKDLFVLSGEIYGRSSMTRNVISVPEAFKE